LGAPQITRAMAAELGQLAKLNDPLALATLANIGLVVYGAGSALNMLFGSGKPVPLDPRNADWATAHVGGHWETIGGEQQYVGGRKIRIIPQASLVRAIGKTWLAAEQGDGAKMLDAWSQLAFTRSTPALQGAAGLAGVGFTPEGYFSKSLPIEQRLTAAAPFPIAAQQALEGQVRPPTSPGAAAELGANIAGVTNFPGDTAEDIRSGQREDVKGELADRFPEYEQVPQRVFDRMVENQSIPPGYKSMEKYREAALERLRKRLEERQQNAALADVLLYDIFPEIALYDRTVRDIRASMRESDPELTRLLIESGEKRAAESDIPALATP
jgi:hypothetical protein